jgi:iron complex outermembrane receptor protein
MTASRSASTFALRPLLALIRPVLGAGLTLAAGSAAAQAVEPSSTATLTEVTVVEQAEGGLQKPYAGGQLARGGSLGILGTADVMDTPFSTTNYTAEQLQNQQARSVADVVANDASVRALTSAGGFGDEFQIRGFTVSNADIGINGLYGLAPTSRLPVEMVERVEVLKGPGTLANGVPPNGSIGGSMNLVTKRAGDEPLTRVTATYLSKSQLGTHVDIGRRFGEDKAWGVRVNGVVRSGEGTIDNGKQQLGLGSLGLDYRSRKLRWSLDALAQRDEISEFRPQSGFVAGMTQVPTAPDSRVNYYPGTQFDSRNNTLASKLEYDLSDTLMVYGGVGYTDYAYQQTFPSAMAAAAGNASGIDAQGNFYLRNGYYDYYSKTAVADAGLRKRFATGSVAHTLTFAANRLDQESGFFYATSATRNASSIYNPAPLPTIATARGPAVKSAENILYSNALTDTMAFAEDRVLLTLGLRDQTIVQQSFNQTTGAETTHYKASSMSPLAGLVFKPTTNVSLYGNYTQGLTRGQIVGGTYSNVGEILAPYKSTQREVGVKVDWGKVMTGVTLFQIERPNAMAENNILGYDGENRNRGLELTAYGEVQRGLRLMTSALFNDAKLTSATGGTYVGNRTGGVPFRTFNLGADWDTPWVQGLSLNGRVINTSSAYGNSENTFIVPGWTRYDVGARYRTQMDGRPLVLRANIENLSDKSYWMMSGNNYATVSAPRTLVVSATIDF